MVELDLREEALAARAVHDLERLRAPGGRPPEPRHVVVRLVPVAEHEERIDRERGVAEPGVAVVPVALAADLLRERRGRRCHDRSRRRVRQPLEDEAASKHLFPVRPDVSAALGPGLPVPDRSLELAQDQLTRLTLGLQLLRQAPGQRDEGVIALGQRACSLASRDSAVPIGSSVWSTSASGPP